MNEAATILSSYSFYPAEMTALKNRLAELKSAGVEMRRARLIRALVHLTSEGEMFISAKRLAAAYAGKDGPRENDNIAGRLEVELLKTDVEKLDRVKEELARKKVFAAANRAFVIRAALRWSPSGAALAPAVRKFLEDFPNKPRGLSKLRLAQKARRHG